MSDSFLDTAKRMYSSSKLLHNNNDFHNACYLAGYVVECYTKIIVEKYSSNQGNNRTARSFSHNLNHLNTEMQYILSGNSALSSYILNASTDFINIFTKWNPVSLRYVDNTNKINSKNISDDFQAEIDLAMQKITKMQIDGVI